MFGEAMPVDCGSGKTPRGSSFHISIRLEHLVLDGAGLDADHAFQPRQQLLHNEGFLRSLKLWDVVIDTGAGAFERLVVVKCPDDGYGDQSRHRLALDPDVVIAHVDAGRPAKPGWPLRGWLVDLVRALLALLHHLIGVVVPAAFENLFRVLHGCKHSHRLTYGCSVGLEMGR